LALYCDVSLPVPLDRTFTYALMTSLEHRVAAGCRVIVPFSGRKLTGVVLAVHDRPPSQTARYVEKLLDERPVIDEGLIRLARWIAEYYCAPLGEVLRGMAPLTGEVRRQKTYSLTSAGVDASRQMSLVTDADDPVTSILRLLEQKPRGADALSAKIPNARRHLDLLIKRGWVEAEETAADRDPLRSPADRLEVEFVSRTDAKLTKRERELLAYLELHPGQHRLSELETVVNGAGFAGRALGRRGLARLSLIVPGGSGMSFTSGPITLNPAQHAALSSLSGALAAQRFEAFLLHGVTGSGKTEVYLRAIEASLAAGRAALMLVPEIALTPAVAAQFGSRFGSRIAILHSAFNDTERAAQWRRIHAGEIQVAIGTRSAVFAPLKNLGLIIVDEEHDGSYKQEETPRYHGRDVAVVRARDLEAVIVLGSATPSLETRFNAEQGKYRLLDMPERIEHRPMPAVELVDMRMEFLETRSNQIFSRRLLTAIQEKIAAREQCMLLMNRRGFSSFAVCRACGERSMCVNCSVALTFHRRDRRMLCHLCGYAEKVPAECAHCGSEHIQFAGAGSERVEDELHRLIPEARIARMDRDTVSGKQAHERILGSFRAGEYDILVGTQMIAKGHDIPNVTLVGIINADIGLGMPDFRAAERTFQLLTQAAGRAGRGQMPGLVLLQTINPDHYAVRFAALQDYSKFYEKEVEYRRAMRYPPFAALANVVVRAPEKEVALRRSGELAALLTPPPDRTRILGPSQAAVEKVKGEFRYQMIVKSASRQVLAKALNRLRHYAQQAEWPATSLIIDVDPMTLL
jgi:primosomal protein N' (replication factor Y)